MIFKEKDQITIAVIGSDGRAKMIIEKYLNESSSEILGRIEYEKYRVDMIACVFNEGNNPVTTIATTIASLFLFFPFFFFF